MQISENKTVKDFVERIGALGKDTVDYVRTDGAEKARNGFMALRSTVLKTIKKANDSIRNARSQDIYGSVAETIGFSADVVAEMTPMQAAVKLGMIRDVDILSKMYPEMISDPGKLDWMPIHIAAHEGHDDILDTLLKLGVDPNSKGPGGWTPLMTALRYGSGPECVELLLKAGADLNVKTVTNWTAAMIGARYADPDTMQRLLDGNPDLSPHTDTGLTALHFAARRDPMIYRMLVESGADEHINDFKNRTPRQMAKARHDPEMDLVLNIIDGIEEGKKNRTEADEKTVELQSADMGR